MGESGRGEEKTTKEGKKKRGGNQERKREEEPKGKKEEKEGARGEKRGEGRTGGGGRKGSVLARELRLFLEGKPRHHREGYSRVIVKYQSGGGAEHQNT